MYCQNCGHEIAEGHSFCGYCGIKVNNNLQTNSDGKIIDCDNKSEIIDGGLQKNFINSNKTNNSTNNNTIRCPYCNSENVSRYEVIYQNGISNIKGTQAGWSWGGGFFGGTISGKSQSGLAKKTAPPPKKKIRWLLLFVILLLCPSVEPSPYQGLCFILAVPLIVLLIKNIMYNNGEEYNNIYVEWYNNWLCLKCGQTFNLLNDTQTEAKPINNSNNYTEKDRKKDYQLYSKLYNKLVEEKKEIDECRNAYIQEKAKEVKDEVNIGCEEEIDCNEVRCEENVQPEIKIINKKKRIAIIIVAILFLSGLILFSYNKEIGLFSSKDVVGWKKTIFGKWKYYEKPGVKVKGKWYDIGGKAYHFNDEGIMSQNTWINYLGDRFYVDENGEIVTSQWVGDYYVGADGKMLKNTTTPDGAKVGRTGKKIKK